MDIIIMFNYSFNLGKMSTYSETNKKVKKILEHTTIKMQVVKCIGWVDWMKRYGTRNTDATKRDVQVV